MTIDTSVALQVRQRAGNRCEYWQMHQSLQGATFHIEHIIPRSLGGEPSITNLAWSCPSCNLHKSDRVVLFDTSGNKVRLFNPRLDAWNAHFAWDDFSMIGLSDIVKALIEAFDLNAERKIRIRQAEKMFDLFPPQD